jgi:hypothetical protein
MKLFIILTYWIVVMSIITLLFWLAGFDFNERGFPAFLYGTAAFVSLFAAIGFVCDELSC